MRYGSAAFLITGFSSFFILVAAPAVVGAQHQVELTVGPGNAARVSFEGLTDGEVEGLALVADGVVVRGFLVQDAPGSGTMRLSLCWVGVSREPYGGAAGVRLECGRLRLWAHGLLLERGGGPPLRIGGPLEPFLSRLARNGRRLVALRGFDRSGTFCVLSVDLQPDNALVGGDGA